jgi:1-acyl-sn-glycerol-3-phosphate acyltransferase
LRHGGSVIDRKDSKQAIPAIKGLGIRKHNRSAVIFRKELEVKQEAKNLHKTGLKNICEHTIGLCRSKV